MPGESHKTSANLLSNTFGNHQAHMSFFGFKLLRIFYTFHSSITYLSKTSKHINREQINKNTYNIGLHAKVHVGLFNRLHVAHKSNTKIEMIYNHM